MKTILSILLFIPLLSYAQLPLTVQEAEEVQEEVYTDVDQQATFPGGSAALMKYLGSKLNYPEKAIKNGQEGTVYVEFVVMEDGTIKDIKTLRGVTKELDVEAVRVIKNMPKWDPAIKNEKNVPSYCRLPIRFQLTK